MKWPRVRGSAWINLSWPRVGICRRGSNVNWAASLEKNWYLNKLNTWDSQQLLEDISRLKGWKEKALTKLGGKFSLRQWSKRFLTTRWAAFCSQSRYVRTSKKLWLDFIGEQHRKIVKSIGSAGRKFLDQKSKVAQAFGKCTTSTWSWLRNNIGFSYIIAILLLITWKIATIQGAILILQPLATN